MDWKPIVLPLDGYQTAAEAIINATLILSEPDTAALIGVLKINDGAHMPDMSGPMMVQALGKVPEVLGIDLEAFLDLKINDVSGTLKNVAGHYGPFKVKILTVSSMISAKGFLELRRALPETELALFSIATDISPEVCQKRWGMGPGEKIFHDVTEIEEEYRGIRGADDPENPFHLTVSSPRELDFLWDKGVCAKYSAITPAIRDEWMTKGQQDEDRITGVRYALEHGAKYVVMGSQMTKGNPARGISAKESRQLTAEEIKKAKIPGA
jgi:orotidine-5'-phosphate decarboxylase